MKIIWAAYTLYASIFFASEQAKKDFRYNRCRNARNERLFFSLHFLYNKKID